MLVGYGAGVAAKAVGDGAKVPVGFGVAAKAVGDGAKVPVGFGVRVDVAVGVRCGSRDSTWASVDGWAPLGAAGDDEQAERTSASTSPPRPIGTGYDPACQRPDRRLAV